MKAAIAIKKGDESVVTSPDLRVPLHELATKAGATVIDGYVEDDVMIPNFSETVARIIQPEGHGIEALNFVQGEIPPEVEAANSTEPTETTETTREGRFQGLSSEQLAQTLRRIIRDQLIHYHEVRVGTIYNDWGTGLSRGSISRHLKKVVEALQEDHLNVETCHGRYWIPRQ